MKRLLFALIALLVVAMPAVAQDDVTFETDTLTITSVEGQVHEFNIEVAKTGPQRGRGLMFREEMADDAGMLFIYSRPKVISMWMQNTILSLDMIFIDSGGKIVRIAENTVPYSTAIVGSGGLAQFVLEVKAGTAARLGLAPGDEVYSRAMYD